MKTRLQTLGLCLGMVGLSVLLASCDGGISGSGAPVVVGTGDGDDTTFNCTANCPDENPDNMGTVASDADPLDSTFNNNSKVTTRDDAIINLVHALSDNADSFIITNKGNTVNPILGAPGLGFNQGQSGYFSLIADTHDLDVVPASEYAEDIDAPKVAGVNPLVLSQGSATTVVIRGSSSLSTHTPEALVLANKTSSNNFNTVQFRIINAAANFATQGNVDLHINPVGSAAVNNSPLIDDFSYSMADTGYIVLPYASYQITATDVGSPTQRIVTLEPISPSPSGSLTIIIRDDPGGVAGVDTNILVINDGDTTGL